MRRFGRALRRTGLVAVFALAAGCAAEPRLADDRIVATIREQLAGQGVRIDDLTCPDLPAEAGRTVRCTFTVAGQPADVVATVSVVDGGGTVTYAVHTEARPVGRKVLEPAVAGTLAEIGAPPGATTCAGDLPARVGAAVTCTLTATDGATDWTVTTVSVDGGKIDYSIEQAGLS